MSMIQYHNIERYDRMDFDIYRGLKGYYSNSFLKAERNGITPEFKITEMVTLGKLVDTILTDPGKVDMLDPIYAAAKSIAFKIKEVFGQYIDKFQKQVSYTATLEFEHHFLDTIGRLDYLLEGEAVIDLKVTKSKDVDALIKYMNYDNQVWNYANMAGVKRKYIMIHSVPLEKTFMKDLGVVTPRNAFWENKILKFGQTQQQISNGEILQA
jgi:PDDEXK-like domain of unknown function (DUF3799)